MPAVLVGSHGPFTWGRSAGEAVFHSHMLEYVAHLNTLTLGVSREAKAMKQSLLDKHFLRKHGPDAYYGQSGSGAPASR
jgi:L-ribulose-5-phosphate 4-epimerase